MTERLARSIRETADALGVTYATVHQAVKSGAMESRRHGRLYLIEPDHARAWLRSLPAGTTNPADD